MKFWGYFSPPQTGYYNLGANSDDGAYGYIIVNGQTKEFVNDWSIAAAFNRTNNNPIYLSANSYYPIYMEWYEGCPTNAAFTPVYQFSSQSSTSALIVIGQIYHKIIFILVKQQLLEPFLEHILEMFQEFHFLLKMEFTILLLNL